MNNTKTPWEFVPARTEGRMSCRAFIRAPVGAKYPEAIEAGGYDYPEEEQREADLQFIVKAVNAHDELLTMLHRIVWQNCCVETMTLEDYDEAKELLGRLGCLEAGFLKEPEGA